MSEPEQEPTQPTQVQDDENIESEPEDLNAEVDQLWGYLQPCSSLQPRYKFYRHCPEQTVGRHRDRNTVVLLGGKVSNLHAIMKWDEVNGRNGMVTLTDKSTNGTWLNGERVGKHKFVIIRDGTEIGFGTPSAPPPNAKDDFRFIFRYTANGKPLNGIYKDYDLNHELGRGTFATVMKAVHRTTGKSVAVKMVHRQLQHKIQTPSEPSAVEPESATSNTFKREIAIMEKMVHPNICSLLETFWEDENDTRATYRCYLVLELVDGGDLLDYISVNGGLSELATKQITYQMCRALKFIHKQGVAHRDLKPENVLLTKDDPPIVKVADFGLAKALDSMTMLRTMCGTPSYLAPEVVGHAHKEKGYDLQVDSWSVGVIVYSMLTNSSPFIENEQQPIPERIRTRQIDWDTLDPPNENLISRSCRNFIQELLEYKPGMRLMMTDSLQHVWFKGYDLPRHHVLTEDHAVAPPLVPSSPASRRTLGPSNGTQLPPMSMLHVGAKNGEPMEDCDVSDDGRTPSPANETAPINAYPLQRRADIWKRSQHDPAHKIPEPDADMIMNFAIYDHSPGPSKPLKRRATDIGDDDDEGQMDIDHSDTTMKSPTKGKGRGTGKTKGTKVNENATPRRSARVRTKLS